MSEPIEIIPPFNEYMRQKRAAQRAINEAEALKNPAEHQRKMALARERGTRDLAALEKIERARQRRKDIFDLFGL